MQTAKTEEDKTDGNALQRKKSTAILATKIRQCIQLLTGSQCRNQNAVVRGQNFILGGQHFWVGLLFSKFSVDSRKKKVVARNFSTPSFLFISKNKTKQVISPNCSTYFLVFCCFPKKSCFLATKGDFGWACWKF